MQKKYKAEEQDQCLLLSHKRQEKLSVQEPLKKQRRTFFKAFHCLVICTAFIYQYKSWSQRSQPKPSANVISFLENLSPAWIHYQLLLDKDCAVLAVPNQLCSQMSSLQGEIRKKWGTEKWFTEEVQLQQTPINHISLKPFLVLPHHATVGR